MKFLSFLKAIGKGVVSVAGSPLGQVALNAVLPSAGNLTASVIHAITRAEERIGAGKGAEKLEYALDVLGTASPAIIDNFEKMTGREIVDQDRFAEGVKKLNEAWVDIFSASGHFPAKGEAKQ